MEQLLKCFLEETRLRGTPFSERELLKIKSLSREKKYGFYKEFYNLYTQFYETLLVPSNTSSFYIDKEKKDTMSATFYDCNGAKIKDLNFKNTTEVELNRILFKQFIGCE